MQLLSYRPFRRGLGRGVRVNSNAVLPAQVVLSVLIAQEQVFTV
jgi:hypothetical protein